MEIFLRRMKRNHACLPSQSSSVQTGFTLVEIMMVVAIVTLIFAVTLVGLTQMRAKSRNTKRVSDIRQFITAIDLFNTHCGSYPVSTSSIVLNESRSLYTGPTGCGNRDGSSSSNGGFGLVANASGTVISSKLRTAPTPADGACSNTENSYTYISNATGTDFTLTFCLGAATANYGAGVRTVKPNGIN